jgi:hypothetical protein
MRFLWPSSESEPLIARVVWEWAFTSVSPASAGQVYPLDQRGRMAPPADCCATARDL